MLLESLLTKLAGAGVAAKAAAGGAAVVVATSAAGAADSLPQPVQQAFDEVVTTQATDADDAAAPDEAPDEAPGDDAHDEQAGASADETDGTDDLGARVAADATGQSDGEPGVDGAEVSREARQRNRGEGHGRADDSRDAADEDDDDVDDLDADEDVEDNGDEDDDNEDEDDGPEGTPGKRPAQAGRERGEG